MDPLARDSHGRCFHNSSISRSTSSLLRYLRPSNSSRNIVHFCGNRCCRRCLFVNISLYVFPYHPLLMSLTSVVFQPKLDILGMVIYATEFVLWCGVFACGGYFNLIPWTKQRLSTRAQKKVEARNRAASGDQADAGDGTHDIPLSRIGSSTSVFRTPSSVASSRHSVRPVE
jgi:hypothetical protein